MFRQHPGYESTKTMRGKVVRYFEDKGYGFLMDETNKQSFFLALQ